MLTILDTECDEVRMLIGSKTKTRDLSNDQIRTGAILGAASDYVMSRVTENVDVSKLTAYADIESLRNDTVDLFLTKALTPLQQNQFRRAVISYCAGLGAALVAKIKRESANQIASVEKEFAGWQSLQIFLFEQADADIERLQTAYPDDAFGSRDLAVAFLV